MFWKAVVFACLAVGVLAEYEDKQELVKNIIRQQCDKNGAADKYNEVEAAGTTFVNCVKELFDIQTIKTEIENAKPKGALDEVFGKYCDKSPQLKTCIHTLLDSVSPCLDASTREQVSTAKEATNKLIDFVCHKGGDRIALFIAEGGPGCFTEKADEMRKCGDNLKDAVWSADGVKTLSTADKCRKFDDLSSCIVDSLEKCTTPTPGNMAESLFKYVRKSSPCHTALPKND